jgi:hypothetical protein
MRQNREQYSHWHLFKTLELPLSCKFHVQVRNPAQDSSTHFTDFAPRRPTMVQSLSTARKHAIGLQEADKSTHIFHMLNTHPTTVCNHHAYMMHAAGSLHVAVTESTGSKISASTAEPDLRKHHFRNRLITPTTAEEDTLFNIHGVDRGRIHDASRHLKIGPANFTISQGIPALI